MDSYQIGTRIRECRKLRDLTQEKLAEAADLSPTYLSHLESGKKTASIRAYARIAAALDVSLEQLLVDSSKTDAGECLSTLQLLLEHSTPKEQHFLCDVIRAMKESLHEHEIIP